MIPSPTEVSPFSTSFIFTEASCSGFTFGNFFMSFTCTSGNRPGYFLKYATGSCPATLIQHKSISIFTLFASVDSSRKSYGNFPPSCSSGMNSQ